MTTKFKHTPEQEALWPVYRDRWIGHAMRTRPMTDEDRRLCIQAVREMYRLIGKDEPRVVFVPSPLVAAMVTGCAAWEWHVRAQGSNRTTMAATPAATQEATEAATSAATSAATWAATSAATRAATSAATYLATNAATREATMAATNAATWAATNAATQEATEAATSAATWAATSAATRAATWAATSAATDEATYAATEEATYLATNAATWAATNAATNAATREAINAVTYAVTYAATREATNAATWAATREATNTATDEATEEATEEATYLATNAATYAATEEATRQEARAEQDLSRWFVAPPVNEICSAIGGEGAMKCVGLAWKLRVGGNQWADRPAMLEWFREIARLPISWGPWMPWVILAEHSGPRYVHEKFVVISDFPRVLKVDNNNRPHSATGPFCAWADGFRLYAWHGIRVPAWIIKQPEKITVEKIDAETNAEIRRVLIDRFGFARYLAEKRAVVVDEAVDEGGEPMRLLTMPTDDDDGAPMAALHLRNSTADPDGTRREYVIRVPPTCESVWEARNWTFDLPPEARFDVVS